MEGSRRPIVRPGDAGAGVTLARNMHVIPELLRESGVEPLRLLADVALDPNLFSDPQNVIPIPALGRLLTACVVATKCDTFGFRIGMKHEPTNAGLAGLAAINAPTVGDALRIMRDYLNLSQTGFSVDLDEQDGTAIASAQLTHPDMESGEQMAEGATAALVSFMRRLLGEQWRPELLLLTRPKSRRAKVFDCFVRAPIQFSAAQCGIAFPASTLSLPLRDRNEKHFDLLLSTLNDSDARRFTSLETEVKSIMRMQLGRGALTLESVAAAFNCGSRTFARRLERVGLVYSAMVDDVKYETARSLLRSDMKLAEIAEALGYAEASVFTRSFRRWSGQTPSAWRLQQGGFHNDKAPADWRAPAGPQGLSESDSLDFADL